jgi:hypothetical protein
MELVNQDRFGNTYQMNVLEDQFLHFTPRSRAKEILKSGKLLMRPPYQKFGTDTVDAVSLTFGTHLPGVQTTHIKDPDVVAIIFKTNTIPQSGYGEEVKWIGDVNLIDPKIIELPQAEKMLKSVKPPVPFDADNDNVVYVDRNVARKSREIMNRDLDFEKAHNILQQWNK